MLDEKRERHRDTPNTRIQRASAPCHMVLVPQGPFEGGLWQ